MIAQTSEKFIDFEWRIVDFWANATKSYGVVFEGVSDMRRVLSAALAALLVTCGSALADGSLKDTPPASPGFSWSGLYNGYHVGYAWGDVGVSDVNSYANASPNGTVTGLSTDGAVGGGQIGYNLLIGNFLIGAEADVGYLDFSDNTLLTGTASGSRVGIGGGLYADITARAGIVLGNSTLVYAKGGWAVLEAKDGFSTVSGSFSRKSDLNDFSGWTIGGGLEHVLNANWTVKLEYQHFDFGSASHTVFSAVGTPFEFKHDLTVDTAKFGLNYHF